MMLDAEMLVNKKIDELTTNLRQIFCLVDEELENMKNLILELESRLDKIENVEHQP